RTGDIGFFKIVAQSAVASGVRRVEAVTAENALQYVQQQTTALEGIAEMLNAQPMEIGSRLNQVMENARALEKELSKIKSKLASSQGDELADQATDAGGVKVLATRLDGVDIKAMRETLDKLKDKLKSCAVVLSTVQDKRVTLLAGVSADLTEKIKAGDLVNFVAQQVGGKGGGRADMAQAGGSEPGKLPQALASVVNWVESRLNNC
ncbi:MAG: DHHA1 domain-containing protein, partial [Burkholderiales bacterium]